MSASIAWYKNGSVVLQAVRHLASKQKPAVLRIARGSRRGRIELARGNVSCVRAGRLEDRDAFQHMLMWGSGASMTSQPNLAPSKATLDVSVDLLIEQGLHFLERLDELVGHLGTPLSTFERTSKRPGKPTLPAEVRRFLDGVEPGMTLVDLIEASTFRPADTLKVCYRLRELGLISLSNASNEDHTVPQALLDAVDLAGVSEEKKTSSHITSRRPKLARPPTPMRSTGRFAKVKEQAFDEVDEAFFAAASMLEGAGEIDRFEDLENTATRQKLRKR